MYVYKAKLIRCVDGDTADFLVDLGFKTYKEVRGRFLGVDTPERGQADYKLATNILHRLLKEQEDDDGYIMIKTYKTVKYGRWLVDIDNVNKVLAERWPYE